MDNHFKNGVTLQQVSIEGFSALDMHQQRLAYAKALHKQIKDIQGNKVALQCMGKVSLYDTYEEASRAQADIQYIDSQIYIPTGHPSVQPSENMIIHAL